MTSRSASLNGTGRIPKLHSIMIAENSKSMYTQGRFEQLIFDVRRQGIDKQPYMCWDNEHKNLLRDICNGIAVADDMRKLIKQQNKILNIFTNKPYIVSLFKKKVSGEACDFVDALGFDISPKEATRIYGFEKVVTHQSSSASYRGAIQSISQQLFGVPNFFDEVAFKTPTNQKHFYCFMSFVLPQLLVESIVLPAKEDSDIDVLLKARFRKSSLPFSMNKILEWEQRLEDAGEQVPERPETAYVTFGRAFLKESSLFRLTDSRMRSYIVLCAYLQKPELEDKFRAKDFRALKSYYAKLKALTKELKR